MEKIIIEKIERLRTDINTKDIDTIINNIGKNKTLEGIQKVIAAFKGIDLSNLSYEDKAVKIQNVITTKIDNKLEIENYPHEQEMVIMLNDIFTTFYYGKENGRHLTIGMLLHILPDDDVVLPPGDDYRNLYNKVVEIFKETIPADFKIDLSIQID